uniref:RHD domain-containing protein n=1 Tax=Panagrellus redivivus TaxID=6233 RepID=A0A7E4VK30_PANRE
MTVSNLKELLFPRTNLCSCACLTFRWYDISALQPPKTLARRHSPEFDDWRPPPSPQFAQQRTDLYDDYFDFAPPSSSNVRISPSFGSTYYTAAGDGGKFGQNCNSNSGMPYFECDSPTKPAKQACNNAYYTTTQQHNVASGGCE